MITREKLKKLNKENLIELILEMSELLTENQNRKYNQIVAGYLTDQSVNSHDGVQARMSDEFVPESAEGRRRRFPKKWHRSKFGYSRLMKENSI